MTNAKILEAAAQLEDIAAIAKMMSSDLRNGVDDPYARVYWLRKQLSYTVATLGEGNPGGQQAIEDHYEKLLDR